MLETGPAKRSQGLQTLRKKYSGYAQPFVKVYFNRFDFGTRIAKVKKLTFYFCSHNCLVGDGGAVI